MKILLAPDKFKGSLSASEVRATAKKALGKVFPNAEFIECPLADGGEGTMQAIHEGLGEEGGNQSNWLEAKVQDARGREKKVSYLLLDNGTAVIEMSIASGLADVSDLELTPKTASTYGTGQLVMDAAVRGASSIILGLGGSATNDGGAGMAAALTYRFEDKDGNALKNIPAELEQATRIAAPPILPLPKITAACDVDNPLLGEKGATRIYGKQKGISDFDFFEKRLQHLVKLCEEAKLPTPTKEAGAGAAGGLGFGLMSFAGATLKSGFEIIAEATHLKEKISDADLVVTGEGSYDFQSIEHGKGPAALLALAAEMKKPCLLLSGTSEKGVSEHPLAPQMHLSSKPENLSVEESMNAAAELLEAVITENSEELQKHFSV